MLQPEPTSVGMSPQAAVRAGAAPGDQQPIRFLLLRQKSGDLPWLVRALIEYMAPAQVVPVVGMANALWRLGRERFDAVLLDIKVTDPALLERCREHIADVAAVPVLNLYETAHQPKAAESRPRPRLEYSRTAAPVDHHEVARLPWERRARREARKAKQAASVA